MTKIYLDHAATTPMRPAVRERLHQLFSIDGTWANSSSKHSPGAEASAVVERARARIARVIDAKPKEVYFTSSATESNNWLLHSCRAIGLRPAVLCIDHSSLLAPLRLSPEGVTIPVDRDGLVQFSALESLLRGGHVDLVSVALINNEIGVIQNLAEIAKLCRKYRVLFHTDAAQALGFASVSTEEAGVDYMTLSSHKAGGPKGIAALFVRSGAPIQSFFVGGGHERGLRSGTVAVELADGFALAAEIATETFSTGLGRCTVQSSAQSSAQSTVQSRLSKLRERLINGLLLLDKCYALNLKINGPAKASSASDHIVSVTIPSIHSPTFVEDLNRLGVFCSAGSACKSAHPSGTKDNPILLAMGRPSESAHHLRLSFGHTTTENETDLAIERLEECLIGFGKAQHTK